MATPQVSTRQPDNYSDSASEDGQAPGQRRQALVSAAAQQQQQQQQPNLPNVPTSGNLSQPAGSILKGATDDEGKLKDAALLVGIKLDLEAEIHLTARIRGDITIGLY